MSVPNFCIILLAYVYGLTQPTVWGLTSALTTLTATSTFGACVAMVDDLALIGDSNLGIIIMSLNHYSILTLHYPRHCVFHKLQ